VLKYVSQQQNRLFMEENTVYVPCNMQIELRNEIDNLAKASERNRSQMMRHLLNIGLEEYKKRELEKFND
jgi:metal-responsive CopG/Arc/MetJ family transcriptional regulator